MANDDLRSVFRERVQRILNNHPSLTHEWKSDAHLVFRRADANGFDIAIILEQEILEAHALGFHETYGLDGSTTDIVDSALGLVRDLLSPGMRIREKRAGRMAYRWKAEVQSGEGWELEGETGMLIFNYLGKRSERIYRNHHLPSRMEPAS